MDTLPKRVTVVKIVFCSNTTWYLWNYRLGLIKTLLNDGNDIYLLAPVDQTTKKFSDLGCRYVPIPMKRKGSNILQELLLLIRFYKSIKEIHPDVLITFTIKPVVYGGFVARFLGIPVVATITGLGTAFIRRGWITVVAKNLYKQGLVSAKTVFFQNHDDERMFIGAGLVSKHQVAQIPGSGIDLKRFSFSPLFETNRDGTEIFLLAGRMLWDKGIQEYVESARIVKVSYPNVEFQLLGEIGSDNVSAISKEKILSWQEEGIVAYLGVTSDVRPYIKKADCVVLPSYREGLSRTLLEAGAIGRPVIATRVVGCKEIVEDGRTGFLVNPKDPADLAAKLCQFLSLSLNERHQMGKVARQKIEEDFDEKHVIEKYISMISSCSSG